MVTKRKTPFEPCMPALIELFEFWFCKIRAGKPFWATQPATPLGSDPPLQRAIVVRPSAQDEQKGLQSAADQAVKARVWHGNFASADGKIRKAKQTLGIGKHACD
jgi:hypothetical protein